MKSVGTPWIKTRSFYGHFDQIHLSGPKKQTVKLLKGISGNSIEILEQSPFHLT